VSDEKGLILHDGRQLPATTDLRRALREGLDSVLAQEFNARGGQEVEKPEDAYPLLRRLGGMSETARDYSRAFVEFAREVEARAGDDLIEMYGEQDGVPNQGAKVPDTDGTVIKVGPDYVNEYAFDVDALVSAHIVHLLADDAFRKRLGEMFAAEFEGNADRSTELLADVIAGAVHGVLALGKFQPQVTKTRTLAKLLSQHGHDGVASTISDATTKTVKHKGTKIERDHPKAKEE
jgi:hypothetical protein